MDVAKYISLFLLKNKFVYLHGLGNLEIRKRPASYNGEALQAPYWEVIMTPQGSIDDNLANFIANNEQTSISKASNELRDFSVRSREALDQGKDVVIPAIGKFHVEKGNTRFTADPHFQYTPASIPALRMAKKQEEPVAAGPSVFPPPRPQTQMPYEQAAPQPEYPPLEADKPADNTVNWLRVGAVILGFVIMIVVVYFVVSYMAGGEEPVKEPVIPDKMKQSAEQVNASPVDSSALTSATGEASGADLLSFDIILNRYIDIPKAEHRVKDLQSKGHAVLLKANEDSSILYVVLPIEDYPAADTARLFDSLTQVFRPKFPLVILEE